MKKFIMLLVIGFFLSGCAHSYREDRATAGGALGGGALGAIVGYAIESTTQATLIGAGAGMLIGGVYSNYLEKERIAAEEIGNTDCKKITSRDYDGAGRIIRESVKEVCTGRKSVRTY